MLTSAVLYIYLIILWWCMAVCSGKTLLRK